LKNKKITIKKNWETVFIIIFLFLNLFSIFFAENQNWSLRKFLYLISVFPIYFACSGILDSREKILTVAKSLVFSGFLTALLGIIQFISQFFIGLPELFKIWSHLSVPFLGKNLAASVINNPSWMVNISGKTYFRATAFFPDPHMFSFFLGMILPLAFYFAITQKNKINFLFFAVIFSADWLTFSRGGYLGLTAGLIFALFIFWNKIGKKFQLVLLFGILLFFLFAIVPNPISSRFSSSFNLNEGSNLGRIEMWKKAAETIAKHPVSGIGLGNFSLTVDPLSGYRNSIYAHNTYLDIASETGILSSLAWIGILMAIFYKFLIKSKKNFFYIFPALSLIIFSVHSLTETGIYSPVVLTLLLIIISFGSQAKDYEKNF